eukprot:m.115860 g.115860  ORF g.115860 m.115860 type:complete len:64 (-) comp14455_c0_seq3:153-344(-)
MGIVLGVTCVAAPSISILLLPLCVQGALSLSLGTIETFLPRSVLCSLSLIWALHLLFFGIFAC